jgi:hypothetical protein
LAPILDLAVLETKRRTEWGGEDENDSEEATKKPLGTLRIDGLEIPASSYQLTIWSRAGDIDVVCPTQTIPLAATQSLGRVLPGRAVSVSFSKEHSPDDYVRGALNLQQAGALAMVIKIGSSQRASDYVQERVCGVGAGARAGSQVLKVPVLLIDAQLGFWQDDDRRISSDDDCSVDDNGEFRLVYELSRAAYRDPHQMNLRLPSAKAIDDIRLPIETENGVLQTNVTAFIKVLERQEEQSPNRGLWIKTLNSITAAATGESTQRFEPLPAHHLLRSETRLGKQRVAFRSSGHCCEHHPRGLGRTRHLRF